MSKKATVSADAETVTVHVPFSITKPRPRASDEEGGRDLPDTGVFALLDALTVLGISALVVVGLWKLKDAVLAAIS